MYGKVETLNIKTIESKISQLDIFRYYCKNFKYLNINFSSEFRVDNNPSARITFGNGAYWYNDFGEVGRPINCYEYVMRKYNVNFNECLRLINADFQLGIVNSEYKPSLGFVGIKLSKDKLKELTEPKLKSIRILKTKKDFSTLELNWWKQFGWSPELLEFYNVISCKNAVIYLDDNKMTFTSSKYQPIYVFDYYQDINRRKMYRPLSVKWKWLSSSNIGAIVQGWEQLDDTGDICFITSSLKDVGTLRAIGFNAIAPASETTILSQEVIDELKKRFKRIICYLDNDLEGLKAAQSYETLYDLEYIVNDDLDYKDPSDLRKQVGNNQKFLEIVNEMI